MTPTPGEQGWPRCFARGRWEWGRKAASAPARMLVGRTGPAPSCLCRKLLRQRPRLAFRLDLRLVDHPGELFRLRDHELFVFGRGQRPRDDALLHQQIDGL